MTKKEARSLYKQKRLSLTAIQRNKMDDLILIAFQTLSLPIPDLVMTYAANERLLEYDPLLIERYCKFKNPFTLFAYPKVDGKELQALAVNAQTIFACNSFGIEEPVDGIMTVLDDIDMVFVPLMAFDIKGYRVGYGKGYYDKFLSQANSKILKIGFSYSEAERCITDVNEYDIPLDICITPGKTYHFN